MLVPDIVQSTVRNHLLSRLAAEDFARLAPRLELVACPQSLVLVERNTPIRDVFFMEGGVASVVAKSPEGQAAEVGVIGWEGFVVPSVVLGSDRVTTDVGMQLAGSAYRIDRLALLDAVARSTGLREILTRFAQVLMVQTTFTALANAVHQIDERLARWLLMCQDRSGGDDLRLTHEFLSIMLSVRRPSVTNALHVLEGNGYIKAERGYVTIRDRAGLEEFAGDAYGQPEAEYRRLIGTP